MHVQDALRSGELVQRIDVLGDEEQIVAEEPLQLGQREVGGIGPHRSHLLAALRIEPPDEARVASEALRRRHVLHPVLVPEAPGVPEGGHAALGADPGPGEHENARPPVDLDRLEVLPRPYP